MSSVSHCFEARYSRVVLILFGLVFVLCLSESDVLQAETFYKYLDENGTIVFTQNLSEVPDTLRDGAEILAFQSKKAVEEANNATQDSAALGKRLKDKVKGAGDALAQMGSKEVLQNVTEAGLRQGKNLLSSFIKDKQSMLIFYAIAGIAGFWMVSKLLKRFVGGFITSILIKLVVVVALFCGVYLFYLSWLSKSVLNFDPVAEGQEQGLMDQITTPQALLQKTKDVVNQFNESAALRNKAIKQLDGP